MTAAALRDEKKKKKKKKKAKELKKEEKKESITHHNLLRIKLYLYLAKYMYYSFNFIGLADYILISQMTPAPEKFRQKYFGLQICNCAWKTRSAYKEEIGYITDRIIDVVQKLLHKAHPYIGSL